MAPEKCPCCDNPWSKATGDFFDKLCLDCETPKEDSTKAAAAATAAAAAATAAAATAAAAAATAAVPSFGLDRANMNLAVNPHDNFFEYANGTWMKNHQIPAGYPSWNTFLSLHVQSQERCRQLLQDLTDKTDATAQELKVAAFYAAAMDESAVEAAGVQPMKPLFAAIDKVVAALEKQDMHEYATLLGKLPAVYGIYPFLSTGASPDYKDSDRSLCQMSQGGLGVSVV